VNNIWFTSDQHFGHEKIIGFTDRPFSSADEMDEVMIDNWNDLVGKQDEVYFLGDLCFGLHRQNVTALVKRLNGHKHAIWGNHDHKQTRKSEGWTSKQYYKQLNVDKQSIVLCHYPFETWNKAHHGAWHLHGHCHGNLVSAHTGPRIDIGVDSWDFKPVHIDTVRAHLKNVFYVPVDHHREGCGP